MKLLVLAALVAAVSSGQLRNQQSVDHQTLGPWQVGKLYRYVVDSHTLARLHEGSSTGSVFKANFIIRVPSPGRLIAKLEQPKHALVHQELSSDGLLPKDLKFEPIDKMDQPFEIAVEGGRISTLTLPASLQLAQENLLKGLISALQLDLSTHRPIRSSYYGFDKESEQGLFKKMETDVTGDCETLYNVYPAIPEWRRELPNFVGNEEPIMISKTKNYGHCHHRVAYHFGVPEGSEWTGTAHKKHEEQFIRRATVTRMLAGKQGPIYKTETTSTVHVNPQLYGKEKAEVISNVQLYLVAFEQDKEAEWTMPENNRVVNSLLYSVSHKQVDMTDSSSESIESFSKVIDGVEMIGNRGRRYVKSPKMVSINKLIVKRNDDGASSSSSSSDSLSAFVNDDVPKFNEPAYAAMYMTPQTRMDKNESPINAHKLVQEMAQQLQNPNNMPKLDFLAKFNILVRVLASMSSEQLSLTSRSIETAKSSNNNVKADMWMIYRDAVAQVGNMPAFQQIKTWIQNKKIQGEEAAQVIASLATSLRYPTKEVMTQFFNLAWNDEVREQQYLNTSVLIAATKLMNMAQVNNETAHSFYPTHMYGRLARQRDSFVVDEVLPRLSQELKASIEKEDSNKALVYIKAIGNLGHRNILQVFAPYLEGKVRVSTFLRMQMVKNLRVLAKEKDSYVRAVLFSITKNIAEHYEVRVAAIENLFIAHPTTAMMQAMAQMTFTDPSVQIRAFLKSCILNAAELKNVRYMDLAKTAQYVKWMVTKQNYGKQYSNKYLNDYMDSEYELGFMSAYSNIGSESSLFPKSFHYSLKSKATGWNKENSISASVSDVQQLIVAFEQQLDKILQRKRNPEANHKYPANKISEMLNIQRDPKSPLEAALSVDFMGQERFFTYTQNDLEQLTQYISKYMTHLTKGIEKHYTKVINQAQVSIMFPVSMGVPFIFKYKEPMVIHLNSKVKGQLKPQATENQDFIAEIQKQIDFTYARNLEGCVGFMDTIVNQFSHVGVVSKVQLQLPISLELQAKRGEIKVTLEPLRPDQDNTLVHYSVWPYSTSQKKSSLVTVSQDPQTKTITRSKKVVSIDTKVGQYTGSQFQIQGYSYSSDYQNLGNLFKSQDILKNLVHILYQRDVAQTHFNLKQLKQSQNKRVVFTFAFDTIYNTKDVAANQALVASNIEDLSPNSKVRRQEMVKRVSAGIKTPRVRVVDMSAVFEGQQKKEYVMTVALSNSAVDTKSQYAIFMGRNSAQNDQINAVFTVIKPVVSSLNFLEAIEKEMKINFVGDVKYGQSGNGNIHIQGHMERTKTHTEELLQSPLAKLCSQQMEKNNWYQYACHKMIVRAYAPDYLKASVTYKDVSPTFRNMTYKAFRMVDHLGFWFTDVNPMKTTPEGKLEIESQLSYPWNTMYLGLSTKLGEVHFNNVPIPKSAASALSAYTVFNNQENILNEYFRDQYQPFCTIDANKIRTFSNRSFDYTLSRSWHVAIQADNTLQSTHDDLVVLAKRPTEQQLELYISFKPYNGKDLEINVLPSANPTGKPTMKVTTQAKKTLDGEITMYFDEINQKPALQYYWQPNGVLIINIQEDHLRIMYDGQRFVILTKGNRNNIRGLCGRMNGEPRDDFLTPTGLVDRPEHFGASFALKEADSDSKTLELQNQAKQLSYPKENRYTVILPSSDEWRQVMQDSSEENDKWSQYSNLYKSRSWLKNRQECEVHQQIQFYENHGEICITTTPLPGCQSHCRSEGLKIQATQVVCRPKQDEQFRGYRDEIRQGQNPQMSEVPQQQPKQFQVPTSCRA